MLPAPRCLAAFSVFFVKGSNRLTEFAVLPCLLRCVCRVGSFSVLDCIGAAAASATKGVLDVFLLLLFGWFGILALPVAFPMFVEGVFLLLFLLGCLLLHTYLWYFAVATLFAAAAYVAFNGVFTLDGNGKVVFKYIVGVRQGSRFAFEQANATPRVDVAETPQASPFLEAQGKTIIQSGPSLVSSRSLLVRALTGQTLVVRWSSSEDVLHCVSEHTGVPSSRLLPHA